MLTRSGLPASTAPYRRTCRPCPVYLCVTILGGRSLRFPICRPSFLLTGCHFLAGSSGHTSSFAGRSVVADGCLNRWPGTIEFGSDVSHRLFNLVDLVLIAD